MVEKFKQILVKLRKHGEISLFVVLKMDNYVDTWSVIICGENFTPNDSETFSYVTSVFYKELTKEERNLIARIGIFDETEYIPQLFADYKVGTEIMKETKINGFVVYEGHILASNIKPKST